MKEDGTETKELLNVKELCTYLGTAQTKAREVLSNSGNSFTVRTGIRLYAYGQSWIIYY